jgi:hypothetical protein
MQVLITTHLGERMEIQSPAEQAKMNIYTCIDARASVL